MYFLGKIVKTRGIKGEVLIWISPHIKNYTSLINKKVVLKLKDKKKELILEDLKQYQSKSIFKFKDINNFEEAYRLIGYSVYQKDLEPAIHLDTLIGFELLEEKTSEIWGKIVGEERFGLNLLLKVESLSKKIIMVPKDLITDIDSDAKKVLIDSPGGLRGLN